MNKNILRLLGGKKFLVAIACLLAIAFSKKLGINPDHIKFIALVAIAYVGAEGSLDLTAIFKKITKEI